MGRFHCYVVYRGRQLGIYQTWTECKAQVLGYPNAKFKQFSSIEEARIIIGLTKIYATSSGYAFKAL
ncbi:hypothetical protein MRB53_034962 [Persea americana]|uniref:Uncharacterized protein n=1 Tax=Persea americana TaxID=3435 RepID=A0ACC2K3D1_PERAE|nr:hypothetical protein MRB53_034962 [Persea americana]